MAPVAGAPDEELVKEARQAGSRDTRAFEVLVRRHEAFVAANCRAITRSPNDVDDLAQEVFVKAYFALGRFEGRSTFGAWLHRIKVNHCLNHLRRTRGAIMVDIADAELHEPAAISAPPTVQTTLQSADDRARILQVLETMSDALRLPLLLRDADGFSYEEIAARLGISLSAVKMRIKRGREEFRLRFSASGSGRPTAEIA